MILLHQSIPCELYMPLSPFKDLEIELLYYFEKDTIDLFSIFWVNDSVSYDKEERITRLQESVFVKTEILPIMEKCR